MFKGSKLITLFVALLGAFLLWLYVVTAVAPETVRTITDIPVTIEGIGDGIVTSDGTYIMTEQITQYITLELKTSRVNSRKLDRQSIRISANVSNSVVQNGPGYKDLNYTITFPDTVNANDIDILKQSSTTVRIQVAKLQTKTVPVELKTLNKVADGYVFERTNVTIEPREIEITGPEEEVDRITKAQVVADLSSLDLTDQSVTMHKISAPFVFQDEDGNEIKTSAYFSINGNLSSAHITLPVQKTKEVELSIKLEPGGGITEADTKLTLDTGRIKVKGVPYAVDKLPDTLEIATVDLSSVLDGAVKSGNNYTRTFEINLEDVPELSNVTNVSGISTITATLTVSGIRRSEAITVTSDQIVFENIDSGLFARAENKEIKIVLQGPVEDVNNVLEHALDSIRIRVDMSGVDGASALETVDGYIFIPDYPAVGIVNGKVQIDVAVTANPADTQTEQ